MEPQGSLRFRGSIQGEPVVLAREPGRELIGVMRAPGVSGLALGIEGPQARRLGIELGDHPEACAGPGLEVGTLAGIADCGEVAADRDAPVVQQRAQLATTGEDVPRVEAGQPAPTPGW